MFYISFGGEPETSGMIEAARSSGKIVMVPVCTKNNMIIRPCLLEDSAELRIGPYGIREPALERPVPIDNLDLVIVPGVAFDKKGNRLGRGKGYYDRFLKELSDDTATIGLAYDFQILPSVPVQAHDVSVKRVLFA